MKVITKASIIFLLLDDYSKLPLLGATIKCNGKEITYSKKPDGHYVFTDIQKGKYIFEISHKGFVSESCEVEVLDSDYIKTVVPLKYSIDNADLKNINKVVFSVKKDNIPLTNEEITLKLETKVPFLRVISPISKASNLVEINSEYNKKLLYQHYCYNNEKNSDIVFIGYNEEKSAFETEKKFTKKLEEGGLLNPTWNIKTDKFGTFVLPIEPLFIKDKADFKISALGKSMNVSVSLNDNVQLDF